MQQALIVDDSKAASYALRQLLQRLQFQVDIVESAELAITYLKQNHPQLVFMDHMMPGMDGFAAVKVIKTNPATADIPIVMYTAKDDDMYVGQARAVGAADILKKPATHEDLQLVLQRVKRKSTNGNGGVPLSAAVESVNGSITNTVAAEKELPEENTTVSDAVKIFDNRFLWLFLLLSWLGTLAFFLMWNQERQIADAQRAKFAEMLVWSFSQAGHYAWNDIPFNDRRLAQLRSLVAQLNELQFKGTLTLEAHVGDFCLVMQRDADGKMVRQLAASDTPVSNCIERGQVDGRAPDLTRQQSPAFRAYVAQMRSDPNIEIHLVSYGKGNVLKPYPVTGKFSSAGAWNAVAASNQIVMFKLSPQP